MTSLRQLTGELTTEITTLTEVIADLLAADSGYQVIQQLPGIGPVLAAVIIVEIGEVTRFKNAGQLCSWAGLTPRHRESVKVTRGQITKQASPVLRFSSALARVRVYRCRISPAVTARGRSGCGAAVASAFGCESPSRVWRTSHGCWAGLAVSAGSGAGRFAFSWPRRSSSVSARDGPAPAAAAAATAVCAAALAPLRGRLQRRVDRRLYPARRAALAAIKDLQGRTHAGAARPEQLEAALREALRDPALRVGYRLPGQAGEAGLVDAAGAALDPGDAYRAPVRLGGDEIGAILRGTVGSRELLREVAAAAALLVEVVRLRIELNRALHDVESSRARLLHAGYQERRRLERDLHDGAQQRLVSLDMAIRLAQRHLDDATVDVDGLLDQSVAELGTAVAELRQIAHGLRPSSLDDGLGHALTTLASNIPVPVTLDMRAGAGYPTTSPPPPTTSPARHWPTPSNTPSPPRSACPSSAPTGRSPSRSATTATAAPGRVPAPASPASPTGSPPPAAGRCDCPAPTVTAP